MPYRDTEDYTGKAVYLGAGHAVAGSLTLDSSLFTADEETGEINLQPGLLLSKPSASDLWGPYDSTAGDGRETATDNVVILHEYVGHLERSDQQEVAYLIEGVALGSKVYLEDGSTITAALKEALRSTLCTVTFALETSD